MHTLAGKKWKRPIPWKQLVLRCSHPECLTGSNWIGVLHRASGFWLNEKDWFCSPRCLEHSLEDRLLGYFFKDRSPAPVRSTMPMGLMMLARGVISDPQLREAVHLQRSSGERIGACLQRLAGVSEEDIASVVATQWGCPLFPAGSMQAGCSMLVPCSLIERYRMLPVHLVSQGKRLFVGFCDKVNHTALLAIEQMLGCNTEACILPEPKLLQGIEHRKHDTTGEVAVSRPGSAAETARMILSYAQQTGSEALRLHEVEGNIWVRFFSPRSHLDLVFVAESL
jgi:hypothetical protein